MWRVRAGLNQSITMSFLLGRHSKFSSDWCFELIKQTFQGTEPGCLQDIVNIIEQSATVISVELIRHENGDIIVSTYDWAGFLASLFKDINSIKSFSTSLISSINPDELLVKEAEDDLYYKIEAYRTMVQLLKAHYTHL